MGDIASEAAKWHGNASTDDAPVREPMRQAAKPMDRRAPSADQKRVRREMARSTKTASPTRPWADKDWERGEHAGISNEPCPDCGVGHAAEYSHEGQWGQGPIFASPCPKTGLTDYLNSYGVDPAPAPKKKNLGLDTHGSLSCVACGCSCSGPACTRCGSLSVTATSFNTNVATSDGRMLLGAGDQIRTPTGQTLNVKNVRRHETSRDHYYVDTDAGTTLVPWSTSMNVVTQNSHQQAEPDAGTPGGNFNAMPLNPQAGGGAGTTQAPGACPACGTKGGMNRRGDKFQCSRCGYSQTPSGGGLSFGDSDKNVIMSSKTPDLRSAVARRAAAVFAAIEEETRP